mmetsp:Transcript_72690/g.234993  ORF Transcript_72690/g.234993 Transcript_72690/m.234993 type:complete len:108 (-) Transcript_72690:142-465(-)
MRHMVQATKCLRGQLAWPVSPWVVPGCNFGCYPACQSAGDGTGSRSLGEFELFGLLSSFCTVWSTLMDVGSSARYVHALMPEDVSVSMPFLIVLCASTVAESTLLCR